MESIRSFQLCRVITVITRASLSANSQKVEHQHTRTHVCTRSPYTNTCTNTCTHTHKQLHIIRQRARTYSVRRPRSHVGLDSVVSIDFSNDGDDFDVQPLGDCFDNVGMILLMILDALIGAPMRVRGFWKDHAAYAQAVLEGYSYCFELQSSILSPKCGNRCVADVRVLLPLRHVEQFDV